MKHIYKGLIVMLALASSGCDTPTHQRPERFVSVATIDPTLIVYPRYATSQNFLGRRVPGYESRAVLLTLEAAIALKAVNDDLKAKGYKLVVYDGYRPQQAVDAFYEWHLDLADQRAKALYYPTVDKRDVFDLGYVAEKSGHSRGSTVDLTMIEVNKPFKPITISARQLRNGDTVPFLDDGTVDMGSSFDLFHEVSHHDSPMITPAQTRMRELLRSTMKKHGFKDYSKEWWHYTLVDEPYPETYFDFSIRD